MASDQPNSTARTFTYCRRCLMPDRLCLCFVKKAKKP